MSVRRRQLRKIQKAIAPLVLSQRVAEFRRSFVECTPPPPWLATMSADEIDELTLATLQAHPVIAAAHARGWLDGIPAEHLKEAWRELGLLDECRYPQFWHSRDGKNVNIEGVEKAIAQVMAKYRTPTTPEVQEEE